MEQPSKTVVRLSKAAGAAHEAGPETRPDTDLGPNTTTTRGQHRPALAARARSPFLPLALTCAALLGWLTFQTWQLFSERQAMHAAQLGQQPTVDNATKLRASLDALAAETQRLADTGNASARLLVEELKRRGVTINAAATEAKKGP